MLVPRRDQRLSLAESLMVLYDLLIDMVLLLCRCHWSLWSLRGIVWLVSRVKGILKRHRVGIDHRSCLNDSASWTLLLECAFQCFFAFLATMVMLLLVRLLDAELKIWRILVDVIAKNVTFAFDWVNADSLDIATFLILSVTLLAAFVTCLTGTGKRFRQVVGLLKLVYSLAILHHLLLFLKKQGIFCSLGLAGCYDRCHSLCVPLMRKRHSLLILSKALLACDLLDSCLYVILNELLILLLSFIVVFIFVILNSGYQARNRPCLYYFLKLRVLNLLQVASLNELWLTMDIRKL